MWLHKIPMRRYFLLRLIVGLILAGILEASEEAPRETKVIFKETSSITDRYSIHENTTPASLTVTNGSRELTSPIVIEAHRNDSNVFRPSQHLGEIEQPAVRPNPFNNVQHVRFENNVRLDTQRERFQNILQDTYLQSPGHGVSSLLDEATRSSRIKFQDDGVTQMSNVRHSFGDRQTVTESPRSQFEEAVGHAFVDQTFFQNVEKPEVQDTSAIFGKPTTDDHRLTGVYYDASRSPYVIDYHQNQNAYQPTSQETAIEMIKKPENNGILVLEEQSTYTRKRKFPYPFYQSGGDYHDVQYIEDPHPTMVYPPMKRPFPWKKIIHLIGTFLPLGLLLATLTPNVIRVGNTTTTQPNIVLSKLRAVDLPVEHKQAPTLDDQSTVCEDRSVCELILAGGELKSNILQNILWNLAARTPDDVAKRNGLREVFSAVRKKDCMAISC
ncbi:hypothetical protein P5V15_000514 [Pogonomyrmex californicus]